MKILWGLVLTFSFNSFAQSFSGEFNFDTDLIREWDGEEQLEFTIPSINTYKKSGKELRYLAAETTEDMESKTFALIETSIRDFKPDVILIDKELNAKLDEEMMYDFSEKGQAYKTAMTLGYKIQGIDLTPLMEYQYLKKEFSGKDAFYYDLTKHLVKGFEKQTINIEDMKPGLKAVYGKDFSMNFKEYKDWFKTKIGKEFNKESVVKDLYDIKEKGHKFNRMAYTLEEYRIPFLLKKVEEAVNKHDKVLVILGASYYYNHFPALEDAFSDKQENLDPLIRMGPADDVNNSVHGEFILATPDEFEE